MKYILANGTSSRHTAIKWRECTMLPTGTSSLELPVLVMVHSMHACSVCMAAVCCMAYSPALCSQHTQRPQRHATCMTPTLYVCVLHSQVQRKLDKEHASITTHQVLRVGHFQCFDLID